LGNHFLQEFFMTRSITRLTALAFCLAFVVANAGESTPVERISVPKDFKIELLYSVPNATQGSWVSLATDPKGRLIAGDQYGSLYRITVPPLGTTEGLKVEKLAVEVIGCHGLLYAFDALYCVVNEGKMQHGLYRVTDTNNDDQFDKVELLREVPGNSGEHGAHSVILSPDGKSLVVVVGNLKKMVEPSGSLVPRVWQEDHISPRMWDANGHAKGVLAPGGICYRVSPDGKDWTIFSMGYRNHFDGAFNANGDFFTYDSDMEWDMNTPWYRPTRVCHGVPGSEFGWRSGSGVWPAYYPDSLPATANIGPGSPTGVAFGYGAKFPKKYQEALYICDWSWGKLYAVHLTPSGASYTAQFEPFITGTPLALSDLVVHPKDRALYMITGGRRVQGGLYRVTYTGAENTDAVAKTPALTPEMELRRSLDAFYGKKDPAAVAAAWPHLGHADRFIRFAARTVLEFQDPASWAEKAVSESNPQAAMTALLGLARVGDKALQPKILSALEKIDWAALSHAQKLDLIRNYHLAFLRMGQPDAATAKKVAARFEAVFPAETRELNMELAQLLVYLDSPSTTAKTMALLAKAPSQEDQLDMVRILRVAKSGWTPELRKDYFGWFAKATHYRGGNSFRGFVNNIKAEAFAALDAATQAQIKPILDVKVQEKSIVDLMREQLGDRKTVKEWTVAELTPIVEKGLKSGRDFDRGRKMFGVSSCFTCHRHDGEGGAFGPDLTQVAGRFSTNDLLEAIIEPNKAISDQYAPVMITKTDGKKVIGHIVNQSKDGMRVNTDMFDPNKLTSVKPDEVKSIEPYKVSPMPEGLLNVLKEDEILDLMAFLLSRGDRNSPMFKK
jgi:putative heme-binding domain-containing protein